MMLIVMQIPTIAWIQSFLLLIVGDKASSGANVVNVPPPVSTGQDSTECNSIWSFVATPSECFLADQLESRDQYKLTNCGTVTVKGTPEQKVLCLFDLCSTDNWATAGLLKTVTHQFLKPFSGIVRTMTGNRRMELPRVLIKVKLDESWLKLVCFVVPDIGLASKLILNHCGLSDWLKVLIYFQSSSTNLQVQLVFLSG